MGIALLAACAGGAADAPPASPTTVAAPSATPIATPAASTIDPDLQAAAEAALAALDRPAALAVIDAPTGAVLALAEHRGRIGVDGSYPPASTFKIVTTYAALTRLGDLDQVECPAEATVAGVRITNPPGLDLGTTSLDQAFARSCNTTFALLAGRLPVGALESAASDFGFNAPVRVDERSLLASFPAPAGPAEQVTSALGIARVRSSPVHMASVAAAVATGTWRAPFTDPERGSTGTSDLDDSAVATLQRLTRAVVTDGTATAADLPGAPVHGKTGTFDDGQEREHAWFIGYRGDLAFAVLVDRGGVGGQVAAPVAADFLRALDRSAP